MMKNLILIVAGLLVSINFAQSQSDVHYSMFKLNRQIFNPAVSGTNNSMTFTSHYRDQWGNFPGAPRTFTFQGHGPFFNRRVGIGLSFVGEEIGMLKTSIIAGSYAYHIELEDDSKLSLGFQGQVENGRIRWELVDALNPDDTTIGLDGNEWKGNFGAGLFFQKKEFYLGLSVPRFMKPTIFKDGQALGYSTFSVRTYYFQMGTAIQMSKNFALEPGILLSMNPSAPFEFDMNLNLLMFNRIGIGMAYRFQDSADAILQIKVNKQLKIAMGLDFTLSALQAYAPNSFELLLQYELNYEDDGIHNIRFF